MRQSICSIQIKVERENIKQNNETKLSLNNKGKTEKARRAGNEEMAASKNGGQRAPVLDSLTGQEFRDHGA